MYIPIQIVQIVHYADKKREIFSNLHLSLELLIKVMLSS